MAAFKYTHAITCRISESFKSKTGEKTDAIDLEEARKQQELYVKTLRELGLDVIELPPDESNPDSVFVEDAAIICNGIALMSKPPENTERKGETCVVKSVLKKELGFPVFEIEDKSATLEGGDVLFTGKEFFVGISHRTNEAGARAVASQFPEFPTTPIKVTGDCHLKSLVTMAGPDVICVGSGKNAQEVIKRMERDATFRYRTITVPEDNSANVMYVNGALIHPSEEQTPKSFALFDEKIDYTRRWLNISELEKRGGTLSSCSILIRKTKHFKNL